MINIPLNEKYKLGSDKDNYIIEKLVVPKKIGKEPYWKDDKWFGSLECLLRYLPEFLARQEEHTTFISLKEGIEAWREYLADELKVRI